MGCKWEGADGEVGLRRRARLGLGLRVRTEEGAGLELGRGWGGRWVRMGG